MNSTPTAAPDLRQIMREHRGFLLGEGIVFLLLGALAIMLPLIAFGLRPVLSSAIGRRGARPLDINFGLDV